jgi:hypothetical protein
MNPGGVNTGGVNPGGVNPGGVNPGGVNPGGVNPGGVDTGGGAPRDVREVLRDEHLVRGGILAALAGRPLTIPEIADATGHPAREVVFWVMGMRKYGYLTEIRDETEDGYFRYRAVDGRDRP